MLKVSLSILAFIFATGVALQIRSSDPSDIQIPADKMMPGMEDPPRQEAVAGATTLGEEGVELVKVPMPQEEIEIIPVVTLPTMPVVADRVDYEAEAEQEAPYQVLKLTASGQTGHEILESEFGLKAIETHVHKTIARGDKYNGWRISEIGATQKSLKTATTRLIRNWLKQIIPENKALFIKLVKSEAPDQKGEIKKVDVSEVEREYEERVKLQNSVLQMYTDAYKIDASGAFMGQHAAMPKRNDVVDALLASEKIFPYYTAEEFSIAAADSESFSQMEDKIKMEAQKKK